MAKVNPNFEFDMYRFVHLPLRSEDANNDYFLERYMLGMQTVWEQINAKIFDIQNLNNPSKIRSDILPYLKDIVGFTSELDYITRDLSEQDLRKIILLGVPLWKTKGLELGFKTIIKLFTGFDARVFTWFDYRMIIGEKAIGEEQLGEDSWLISSPGVISQNTTGNAILLLQFDDKTARDGSLYQHQPTLHGNPLFEDGGAIGQSSFYPVGNSWCIRSSYHEAFRYIQGLTFECYFKTDNGSQLVPILYNWDFKGIKLYLDTAANTLIFTYSDGFTTDTDTWSLGITSSDFNWHHIAFVLDWKTDEVFEDGICSAWVDGVRIGSMTINNSITPDEVRSMEALLIGAEDEYGTRYDGAFDMIRLVSDIRYNPEELSITPPGIKFIEYQAEELDEFQIDVRVVDDGTLDRIQLKRIINLMRPVGERVNIAYIDFYDEFEAGKGKFSTILGNAYVEVTDNVYYMKLPSDSLEHVSFTGSSGWKNYIAQSRISIYSGKEFEIRWLIQDQNNYYAFRINADTQLADIFSAVGGVRSQLASSVPIDIGVAKPDLYDAFYIISVSCYTNDDTGITTIRAFIDSNKIFEVDDGNYTSGTFGLYSPVDSFCWCSEVEMFQLPLETERINPNDKF